jgi:O-antigen ligase
MMRSWVAAVSPNAAAVQEDSFGPAGQDGTAWLRRIESDARARVPESLAARIPAEPALTVGAAAPPRRFTFSLLPGETLERAFWYSALLLAFVLAQVRTANPVRAAAYRAVLFGSFGALAVVGLLNHVTAPTRLLWLRDAPPTSRPFGPFVNPSHFGGVMELAVPWLLGYGLSRLVTHAASARDRAAGVLALLGAGIGAAAALLAASKMSAITIGATSIVILAIVFGTARRRARTPLLIGSAASLLVVLALALWGPLSGRLADFAAVPENGLSGDMRRVVWGAGVHMADDFRWTGIGFGAFGEVFPAYLPRGESEYWAQIHNDYLEIYVGGGLVALALTAWLAGAFIRRVVRALRMEPAARRTLPALGLVLGLAALAVHETVDFNLQIPANALLFVVLAAMSVSPLLRTVESP